MEEEKEEDVDAEHPKVVEGPMEQTGTELYNTNGVNYMSGESMEEYGD